uniref:Uncharacterized protein n=1 Tax=Pelusios castaneus TaxID=367368 RepID=A0A8C8SUV8_9SAUR
MVPSPPPGPIPKDRAELSCPPPTATGSETSAVRLARAQHSRRMVPTHQRRVCYHQRSKTWQLGLRNFNPFCWPLRAQQPRLRHRELGSSAPAPAAPAPAPPAPAPVAPASEMIELALWEPEIAPGPALGEELGVEELTLDDVLEIMAQLEYHTHAEEGVDICSDFLLARCFSGASCPQHHTQLPYHWQLWYSANLPPHWLSVGPEAHETLERIYSDPERTHVRASYQGVAFDIDLMDMNVWNSPHFTRVRRLSTSAAPGTPFRTTQTYYWKSLAGWQKYGEPFVQRIEAGLQAGQEQVLCSTAEHKYQLHLGVGYQRNVATGTVRPLRARPAFRAPALLLPELRTLSESLGLDLAPPPAPEPPPYPETWLPMAPEQDWLTAPMALGDHRFRVVYSLFHKSLPETQYRIVDVSRVQNRFLWDKYMR